MRRIVILFLCMTMAFCTLFSCTPKNENKNQSYAISYYIQMHSLSASVSENMWKENGKYPKVYKSGEVTIIDALLDVAKDETTYYVFEGWYYDSNFQEIVLNNEISASKTGDLSLYAKITEKGTSNGVIKYSISYKWKEDGAWKDIETLPSAVVQGLVFPAEYEKGVPLSLPILPNWNKNERVGYEFDGWYYDETLENKVRGNTLSQEQAGDLVLYTEFLVWIK